ncbi:MAG: DUF4271 domain-containing protein [Flavobacterium sp.]|nr:DUF4271 domain-containing protein [Pedobacter sp.]
MAKKVIGLLCILLLIACIVRAQSEASSPNIQIPAPNPSKIRAEIDSAELKFKLSIEDSLITADSLSMLWIKAGNPNRPNRFVDSLINLYKVEKFDFQTWAKKFPKKSGISNKGEARIMGERWVIITILCIILFFAILKNAFSKELSLIIESMFNNRTLNQISREDNLFSTWPFLFLYVLFGFTIGMFLYLCGQYLNLQINYKGFEWFLILSLVILGLFTLKIVVLRVLGFFFGVQKLVKEYVTLLYLSYFSIALIFLPLVIAFSLTPASYAGIYAYIAIFFVVGILSVQFIRLGRNILSTYHFSKIYLFIYLCALEICPLLILFKALRY